LKTDFSELQIANETQLFMLRCMIQQYAELNPTDLLPHKTQNIIDMLDTVNSIESIELIAGVETRVAKDIYEMFIFVLSHKS
jgi:hypothetical protein